MTSDTTANWQRRWHPLLQQWVIIAANSAQRPWSGAIQENTATLLPEHDPNCYLCPRVTRASGHTNPDYKGVFAFDNDFATLSPNAPQISQTENPLRTVASAQGQCRVLAWSENHNDTLASISADKMIAVAKLWQQEYETLSLAPNIEQVLIFENKGTEIGVSNLHPHGQIYASSFVTETAQRMRTSQAQYADANDGHSMLQNMLNDPLLHQDLLVEKNQYWSVIVPFAARFSYETWIVPHRKLNSVAQASDAEIQELALCYQRQVQRYDTLFQRSAPNITLLHNAPCDDHTDNQHWSFHIAFHPPLRDSEKLKYLAGFESGSNNIVNPMQPEHAAAQLRTITGKPQS